MEESRSPIATTVALMESGEEQEKNITLVTPKGDYVLQVPTELTRPVEETCKSATTELVCNK